MNKELKAGTEADNDMQPIVTTSASLAQSPLLAAALFVKEGNKIIAAFIGMVPFENPYRKITKEDGLYRRFNKDGTIDIVGDLNFYSSWDWFMPAYKKFSSLTGQPMPTFIIHYRNISQWVERVNIEEAFKSLVYAIAWYNDVNGLSIGSR